VTTEVGGSIRRKRGSIRRMGASLQVRVSAGDDPSTGERIVLVEAVPIKTVIMITSGGKRKPAKPDRDGDTRAGRRCISPACPLAVIR